MSETRTYLGESLEQLLPQIREELGNDAVVVRQREGIVGGVGGFFGKRCVEIEVQGPLVPAVAMPARAVINAYDTGGEVAPSRVFETILAQAEHFAPAAVEPEPGPEFVPEPVFVPAPEPVFELAPEPAPVVLMPPPVPVQSLLEQLGPIENDDFAGIRTEMLAAALPVRLVGEMLAEAEQHLLPFEPGASLRTLTRRVLAGRIKTTSGWRTKQRTVAVVGLAGSGRTLTTASLAAAYASAGKSVTALSLEPARDAMRLGELLSERDEIDFQIVDAPARVRSARARLDSDLVIADTPPAEGGTLKSTLALLRALQPDETHLVLPSGLTAPEGQAVINTLAEHKLPTRIVITHADDQRPSGAAVGLALAHRIPVSFLGQGSRIGRLQPAEPEALARMVLR